MKTLRELSCPRDGTHDRQWNKATKTHHDAAKQVEERTMCSPGSISILVVAGSLNSCTSTGKHTFANTLSLHSGLEKKTSETATTVAYSFIPRSRSHDGSDGCKYIRIACRRNSFFSSTLTLAPPLYSSRASHLKRTKRVRWIPANKHILTKNTHSSANKQNKNDSQAVSALLAIAKPLSPARTPNKLSATPDPSNSILD